MFRGEDIALFCHGDVCVDFRNVDGAVSEHLLNITDIYIRLQKTGGKSMPEHMRCDMQFDRSERAVFAYHSANRLIRQRTAGQIDKEMPAFLHFRKKFISISFQYVDHIIIPDLYPSFFRAFTVNQDRSVIQVDIADSEGA